MFEMFWYTIPFILKLIIYKGVHRAIGPHITRVRSTRLDLMFFENVEVLQYVGNKKANKYYEMNLRGSKPRQDCNPSIRKTFIYNKYLK